MSFYKTKFFILLLCVVCCDLKGENYSFLSYASDSGFGFDTISKYYKSRIEWEEKKGDGAEEYHMAMFERENYELSKILLDNAVMEHVENLSAHDANIMLQSHKAWIKHFNHTYKSKTIGGNWNPVENLKMETSRLRARWSGVRLEWDSYLLYDKIGNMCQVRLNDKTIKMILGEVCYKQPSGNGSSYYLKIPAELLPETCLEVSNYYAAVIKSLDDYIEGRRLYLCTWDAKGEPVAVHVLETKNNYIKTIESCKIVNNQIEIIGKNQQYETMTMTFDVTQKNSNQVSNLKL